MTDDRDTRAVRHLRHLYEVLSDLRSEDWTEEVAERIDEALASAANVLGDDGRDQCEPHDYCAGGWCINCGRLDPALPEGT